MSKIKLVAFASLVAMVLGAACSGDEDPPPVEQGPGDDVGYAPGNKDVIVVDGTTWVVSGGDPDGCVWVGDQCLDWGEIKQKFCGDANAQADIVVVSGKVVEVICYPPKEGGVSIQNVPTDADGNPTLPQNQNHTVITFPASTDGKPVKGDVTLNGEGVALIGNGVDKTILGGNLTLDSNNARVRGLTVNGNVTFSKNSNGASLAFCKIKGNLTIEANDVTVLNCVVYGNLESKGNGASLIGNGVAGNFKVEGSVTTCSGNYAFSDKNGNGIVEPGEKGAALSCPK